MIALQVVVGLLKARRETQVPANPLGTEPGHSFRVTGVDGTVHLGLVAASAGTPEAVTAEVERIVRRCTHVPVRSYTYILYRELYANLPLSLWWPEDS